MTGLCNEKSMASYIMVVMTEENFQKYKTNIALGSAVQVYQHPEAWLSNHPLIIIGISRNDHCLSVYGKMSDSDQYDFKEASDAVKKARIEKQIALMIKTLEAL